MVSHQRAELLRNLLAQLTAAQLSMAICLEELGKCLHAELNPENPFLEDPYRVPTRPVLDMSTFSVVWKGKSCSLGHIKLFRLLHRLARRPNHYVSYDQLLRDVWEGDTRSHDTIRSAVKNLKKRLRTGRMNDLARAIQGEGRHYGLILNVRS